MQIAMMAVMALSLLTAVIVVVIMSIRLFCRTMSVSRYAGKAALGFSREDTFDIPLRFGYFSIFSCGHSPHVFNVVYGRIDDRTLYSFDYCYEVGHGTRRLARHYRVIVLDAENLKSDLLMWSDLDVEAAPLSVRQVRGRYGNWSYTGSEKLAALLWRVFGEDRDYGISVEMANGWMLFCVPFALSGGLGQTDLIEKCRETTERICKLWGEEDMPERQVDQNNRLEKAPPS